MVDLINFRAMKRSLTVNRMSEGRVQGKSGAELSDLVDTLCFSQSRVALGWDGNAYSNSSHPQNGVPLLHDSPFSTRMHMAVDDLGRGTGNGEALRKPRAHT